jgi:hypothetical protein
MTFQLDTLIAIAFLVPVAFFAVLDVLTFRARGYQSAVKPVAAAGASVVGMAPSTANVTAGAANDSDMREAA